MEWRIGDVTVTHVRESVDAMPFEIMFPEGDPAVLADNLDWAGRFSTGEDGTLPFSQHALVLQSSGQLIVVDPGIGTRPVREFPQFSNRPSRFMDDFRAAGFDPDDVDVVICTHLHLDHVGWNTTLVDGRWVPTFPNARYVFTRVEYEHWDAGAEGAAYTFDTAVRPLVPAGVVDLVDPDHVVNDEIRFEATPGHSPGHVSLHISSAGEEALITGDVVHHPIQFAAPQWRMFLDDDPELARRTRTELVERYCDTDVRIFGTHFADDSTGFLRRVDGAVRFA